VAPGLIVMLSATLGITQDVEPGRGETIVMRACAD
jgi:hypothetical protein